MSRCSSRNSRRGERGGSSALAVKCRSEPKSPAGCWHSRCEARICCAVLVETSRDAALFRAPTGNRMSGVNDGGSHAIAIAIGGLPIGVRCATPGFILMLEHRYAGFLSEPTDAGIQLDIDLQVAAPPKMAAGEYVPGRGSGGPLRRWPLDHAAGRLPRGLGSGRRAVGGYGRNSSPMRSMRCCASCTAWSWRNAADLQRIRPVRCETAAPFCLPGYRERARRPFHALRRPT